MASSASTYSPNFPCVGCVPHLPTRMMALQVPSLTLLAVALVLAELLVAVLVRSLPRRNEALEVD